MRDRIPAGAISLLALLIAGSGSWGASAAADELPGEDGHPTTRRAIAGGELIVNAAGELLLVRGGKQELLDREVVPELAISASGKQIAYPRRGLLGTELVLRTLGGAARVVSGALRSADRPLFAAGDTALVFWGTGDAERFVGMYVVSVAPGAVPVRRNNVGVTSLADPLFVEPPLDHRSIRLDADGDIRYQAPAAEVTQRLFRAAR